jgi:hypothetical protein
MAQPSTFPTDIPEATRALVEPLLAAGSVYRLLGAKVEQIVSDADFGGRRYWMADIGCQDPPKMPFIEDEQVIQTLLADAAYPSIGKGIDIAGLNGREQNLNSLRFEDPVEHMAEFGAMV